MRVCKKCKTEKKLDEFYNPPSMAKAGYKDGVDSQCKQCRRTAALVYTMKRYRADPKKAVRTNLDNRRRRLYGVSPEQFDGMLDSQSSSCAICGEVPKKRPLCVDHNHANGKVRALLCDNCNNGLGKFKDRAALLRKAAKYVEQYQ